MRCALAELMISHIPIGTLERLVGHSHGIEPAPTNIAAAIRTIVDSCASCAKIMEAYEEGAATGWRLGYDGGYAEGHRDGRGFGEAQLEGQLLLGPDER